MTKKSAMGLIGGMAFMAFLGVVGLGMDRSSALDGVSAVEVDEFDFSVGVACPTTGWGAGTSCVVANVLPPVCVPATFFCCNPTLSTGGNGSCLVVNDWSGAGNSSAIKLVNTPCPGTFNIFGCVCTWTNSCVSDNGTPTPCPGMSISLGRC